MSHETREAYIEKLGARLKEWNAKIKALKATSERLTVEQKADFREQLESLNRNSEELKEKLSELQSSGKDAWERFKSGIEDTATKLEHQINSVSRERKH